MSIHEQSHGIVDGDDHSGGSTASSNEVNVVGTNDAGALVEVAVEEGGVDTTTSKIVKRAADGHIRVPTSGQESYEVPTLGQVESLISEGIWKSPAHSFVADQTSASVGDGGAGGPALVVGDLCVNTTDQKKYYVTAGTGNGSEVTWDAGTLPTTQEVRIDQLTDHTWTFDTDTSTWLDQGSTNHSRQHAMTSADDHTAGNWKVFQSDGSGDVQETALAAAGSPFLAGGAAAAAVFGTLLFASAPVTAAGATPVDTDVSSWGDNTLGVVVGTGGRVFGAYKNATDVYYVELTAI